MGSGSHPAQVLALQTQSPTHPPTHTIVWNYIRTGSGKLVCGAHSCCINIYKTCWWTLQMSKCLLFRLLCQYLLSTSPMHILQGFCLFGGLVLGWKPSRHSWAGGRQGSAAGRSRRTPTLGEAHSLGNACAMGHYGTIFPTSGYFIPWWSYLCCGVTNASWATALSKGERGSGGWFFSLPVRT